MVGDVEGVARRINIWAQYAARPVLDEALVGQLHKAADKAQNYPLSKECMQWFLCHAGLADKKSFECQILNLRSESSSGKLNTPSISLFLDSMGIRGQFGQLEEFWSFLQSLPREQFTFETNLCTSYLEALLRMNRLSEAKHFIFGRPGVLNDDVVSKYNVELDNKMVHRFCMMAKGFAGVSRKVSKGWFESKWPHINVERAIRLVETEKRQKKFERVSLFRVCL